MRWFLAYAWRYRGEVGWSYENQILDVHPIRWVASLRSAEEEEYRVLFYERVGPQEPYVEALITFALKENSGEIWPLGEEEEG